MVAFPGSKINLGLHVLRRRNDGYHDIDTIFYPLPWSDILEILPAENVSFSASGLPIPGDREDNLCMRAYRLLQKDFSLPPIQGHLHKIVPMGSGLGGGSADAAHTLRLLNAIFSLHLSGAQMQAYAAVLGSDCSFFTQDAPSRGRGRGEILETVNLDLHGYFLVVVSPGIHVSTSEAYEGVSPQPDREGLADLIKRPVPEWRNRVTNDFEETVFRRFPGIGTLKNSLYALGADYAGMSGSGSSVFGLFRNAISRESHFPGAEGWSGWL